VPNAVFTLIAVENASRMLHRRIYETIGVRYVDIDKVPAIVAEIKAMLVAHPEIEKSKTTIVNFVKFAASSLDIMIYTFTRTTSWIEFHEIQQEVMLKIANIIAAHGAELAFPTRTLHLESMPTALAVQ
jgi:MscS family membrane protein